MNSILVICLSLVISIVAAVDSDEVVSYDGYKVWSVTPDNNKQLQAIQKWEHIEGVDFWEAARRTTVEQRIMIAPMLQNSFVTFLSDYNITNELIINNVEDVFQAEREIQQVRGRSASTYSYDHFWSTKEINDYLNLVAWLYSDICSLEIVSSSSQGQLIRALRISTKGGGQIDGSRPVIAIDAGIHAREWIAPMVAIYIIDQLVANSAKYKNLLDKVDIVIIPSMNPDGYDFSHSSNRLWRKTRVRNPNSSCVGVDGNRNYGHMWQTHRYPCQEDYSGSGPFSEPEAQALRNVLDEFKPNVKLYLSLHSHGKYVLYPWGYAYKLIDNWQQHKTLGDKFAQAVQATSGTKYTVGNSAFELYPAPGASDDYAASAGVPLAYTIELPGGGRYGFDLPANQIQKVVQETFNGFLEMLKYVGENKWN